MLIPMEILSQIIPRADSGVDTRQRTVLADKAGSIFAKVLEQAKYPAVPWQKAMAAEEGEKAQDCILREEDEAADANVFRRPLKPDKRTQDDDNIIAGVLGYRNMVVFVLEGDMESATNPEMKIGEANMADEEQDIEFTAPIIEESNAKHEASEAVPEQQVSEAVTEPPITITPADVKAGAEANKAPVDDSIKATDEANDTMGEVTARRPIIRTSEQQENESNETEFSNNGYLSPLENENDAVPVKGHKEKTFSEAVENAKSSDDEPQALVLDQPTLITDAIKPERFNAVEQLKKASDAPVAAENLFDEMVSRIDSMHSESKQALTIQLKPEFLGNVALEVAMEAGGLHIKINASDSDVRGMINSQINALVESLENKGIEVVEVEVAYTGVDNGAFKDSHNNHPQPDRPKRSFRLEKVEDGAAYYAALPFDALEYYLDVGVSSVEYSA